VNVLEDFRPVSESLEWRIGDAYWADAGARAFLADEVPHLITNDGMFAARDAAVLFESCLLAERAGELEREIAVMELGAGQGVYARQFLDQFAATCGRHGRDFYDRLTYHVTDRSARMLEDIGSAGTLAPHDARVLLGRVDATDPSAFAPCDGQPPKRLGGLRAIVHSYVLDGLAFDVVLRAGAGWMRLHYRTSIDEAAAPAGGPAAPQLRGDEAVEELLPESERFVAEHAYFPCDPSELPFGEVLAPFADELEAAGAPAAGSRDPSFVHSHGALTSLRRSLDVLRPDGFVLFHDYASSGTRHGADTHQRFARSRATALNFDLLDHVLTREGRCAVVQPQAGAAAPILTRLLCPAALPELADAFRTRYDMTVFSRLAALVEQARATRESDPAAARDSYARAHDAAPENWYVLLDWAGFEYGCDDPDAAIELALRAAAMNPTGAPVIHDVLGEALAAVGRTQEAAAAYGEALRLHADDIRARVGLACLHAFAGRFDDAIVELGGAIVCDRGGANRGLLLARLEQVLDMRDGVQP
jgi:hypothetical protein